MDPIKLTQKTTNYLKRKLLYILSIDIIEIIESIITVWKLSKIKYQENSVLIIEPNDFHGEILPGFSYYFNKLNYKTTLLIRRKNHIAGVFSLFSGNEKPTIFCINNWFLKKSSKYFVKFDIVVITSTIISQKNGYFGHYFNYFNQTSFGKIGTLAIEHNIQSLIPYIIDNKIEKANIFLLNTYYKDGINVKMINPNYFGYLVKKSKTEKKVFITIGSISRRNRNFNELIDTVKQINQTGEYDFEVLVIGRNINTKTYKNLPKQIKIIGEVSYKEMYYYLQHSDFFLTLLDPKIEGHRRYLEGETTGSRQLIHGFNVLPIIQIEFAEAYKFDDSNSFIYENSLFDGMVKALKSDNALLEEKNKNLQKLTETIRLESLLNLKSRLDSISRNNVQNEK